MIGKNEYLDMISALIDDISADFILPKINIKPKKNVLQFEGKSRSKLQRQNTLSREKKVSITPDSFRTDRRRTLPLIPSQFNEFIISCTKCTKDGVKSQIDNLPFHPYIMFVSDLPLDNANLEYVKKILSSITINTDCKTDVYFTRLIKCDNLDLKNEYAEKCFLNLKEEIKLVSPYSLLCFGKFCNDIFLQYGYNSGVFEGSIPYIIVDKKPLEIKDDKSEKNKLWDGLKLLKKYFLSL